MPSDEQKQGGLKAIPDTKDAVAVALHQSEIPNRAPEVLASGRGSTAEQILEIAFSLGIKVREDSDLAQVLSAVNEKSEIPVEAFVAVAEILVYLYQANGQSFPGTGAEEDTEAGGESNSVTELAKSLADKWYKDSESKL